LNRQREGYGQDASRRRKFCGVTEGLILSLNKTVPGISTECSKKDSEPSDFHIVFFTATKKTNYQSLKFLVILGRAKSGIKSFYGVDTCQCCKNLLPT